MNEASREETLTCVSLQWSCLPTHADHVNTSGNRNLCLYKDCAENEALKSKPELRLTQDGLSPLVPVPNCVEVSAMYTSAPLTQCIIRLHYEDVKTFKDFTSFLLILVVIGKKVIQVTPKVRGFVIRLFIC